MNTNKTNTLSIGVRVIRVHSCSFVALIVLLVATSLSATPSPRSGWVYIPGAQDLIQAGQFACLSGLTATPASLSVSAPASGYNTVINTTGPVLKVAGDFSVLATLSAPSGSTTFLTLVGTLSTGSNWWNGLKRLDVGVANGTLQANYWTGASSSATGQNYALPSSSNPLNLEVARVGAQIVIFVGSTQIGAFADPGLFASGQAYLGFNVAPTNTLTVTGLAAAMPASGASGLFAPYTQVAARSGTALRDAAATTGFLVGAAINPTYFSESAYAQTAGREFNLAVAENAMKFAETEPSPHQFSFCAADQVVQFAQANQMLVRGHNLVWGNDLPAWLTGGNYSASDAAAILQEHINTVMGRFKGQAMAWDVVNEAVADSSPYGLKSSYWLTQLGQGYVDQAFLWARAADPYAKLFYNDYSGEGLGGKSDAIYNMVKGMIGRGIPIDGVGLQAHFTSSAPSQADISANIARLGALGLEVHITELDVRVPVDSTGAATAANLAAEAQVYQSVANACRANSNCTAVLTWGVSDAHSWIPAQFSGYGAGLLFDANYNSKPAYDAVKSALSATATAGLPVIATGGVVIHGGTSAIISPGSLVDIYGSNLASAEAITPGFPLPTTLGNVQVTVNGAAAPLYYVSPTQILFQIPYSTSAGPVLVQVKSGAKLSASAVVTVQTAAPGILTYGSNWAVAVHVPDNSVNSATNCAAPGSYLTVYLIGSGPLDNGLATGTAAPSSPLSRETLTTTATIGGTNAPVTFAGMTPGSIGLMQVNLQAPNVTGTLPLQIQVGSYASNTPSVCVK